MPKKDLNQTAAHIARLTTREVPESRFNDSHGIRLGLNNPPVKPIMPEPAKNPAAVALGRLGGLKGGKARAESMSAAKRKAIAKKAAESRWSKHKS